VPENAVAVVGGAPVSRVELERAWQQTRLGYAIIHRPWPSGPARRKLRERVLRLLVRRHVLALEARRRGLVVSHAYLMRRLAEIKRETFHGSEAAYRRDLRRKHLREVDVLATIEAQVVEARMFDAITKSVTVGTAEAHRSYRRHIGRYRVGVSRPIAFVAFPTLAGAKRFLARGGAGSENDVLTTLAVRDAVAPRVWAAIAKLRGRGFRSPVRLRGEWYVIRAEGPIREPRTTPFAQVRDQLRAQLLEQKRKRLYAAWLRHTIARADVQYQ
jgi:SurA-like N-terminal domain